MTDSILSRWNRRGVIGARVFLGLVFFTGGMSKLIPFPGVMGPVWLEDALAPHNLAGFARFVAWSETLIGLCLLVPRLATVGAIMLVPLVVNILAVALSMNWRGTPYVVTGFLLMNVYLLANDRAKLRFLFAEPETDALAAPALSPKRTRDTPAFIGMGLVLAGPLLHALSPAFSYVAITVGLALILFGALAARQGDPLEDPL